VITTAIEHKAVLQSCAVLERQGFDVTYLSPDASGRVEPGAVDEAITDRTVLVSVMAANNEVGTIQPIAEIGNVCRGRGVLYHVDAIQATPFLPIDVDAWQVDLLSLSAHKLYGPKGVGALFVRRGTALLPQVQGGAQERQRRAGTENVAGIVGFARAFALIAADGTARADENSRQSALRDRLLAGLTALDGVHATGHPTERLPNSASVVVDGVEGGDLVAALDLGGLQASTGSACTTGSVEPSHVLLALGLDEEVARGSLRLTTGRGTTEEEIASALDILHACIARLRAASPEAAATEAGARAPAPA
jgi:cysteine desulfurase